MDQSLIIRNTADVLPLMHPCNIEKNKEQNRQIGQLVDVQEKGMTHMTDTFSP